MNMKSLITSTLLLFGMGVASIGTAAPYWDARTFPGVPPTSVFNLEGSPVAVRPLSGYPNCIVATNGTVYALGTATDWAYGSEGPYLPGYLMCWTHCSGWTLIASFGANSNYYDAYGVSLCLGASNKLYVGGTFTAITNLPDGPVYDATNIAVYNLTNGTWLGIGSPSQFGTNMVSAVTVDTNQNVYIATCVTNDPFQSYPFTPTPTTNLVMVYSNNLWKTLGGELVSLGLYTGGNWSITALVADRTDVYVAGSVLGAYNGGTFVASTNIIKWNGHSNAWQAMYEGPLWEDGYDGGSQIASLAVSGTNVFIAGPWSTMGGPFPTSYGVEIISTNGTIVSTAGQGLLFSDGTPGIGYTLAVQNGSVYVGGDFQYIGASGDISGTSYNGIAQWTNNEWLPLPVGAGTNAGVNGSPYGDADAKVFMLAADESAVYVFGQFTNAGGIDLTNIQSEYPVTVTSGARWVTTSEPQIDIDPCPTGWPLININFENEFAGTPPMKGQAAFGFSANDYWNQFQQTVKCNSQPYTNINNLTNVFGYETGVGISISTGAFGSGSTTGSTIALLTNFCHSNCESNAVTLTVTGLPSVGSGGVSGVYDIYLYGYGGTTTISGTEYSENAQFTISPSGTNYDYYPFTTVTTLSTASAVYDINTGYEGNQYVVFPNVQIPAGSKLEITVAPDPSSPVKEWSMNGLQIVPFPYYP